MNDIQNIQLFTNPKFGKVRALTIDGDPWFAGKDVAECLGYSNASKAVVMHVDEEDRFKVMLRADSQNGNVVTETTMISESGVYALVFSSKLPSAKEFKRWVTSEALPSIRKHGAYATPATIENIISNPDFGIRLLQELKEEKEKNEKLSTQNSRLTVDNQVMQPKAEYFDELVDRNLLTSFTDAAKELGIKRKDFIVFLLDGGYIYRDKRNNLMPRANAKTAGLFEVKQCSNAKTKWAGCQTLLTPKGMETFRLLCQGI